MKKTTQKSTNVENKSTETKKVSKTKLVLQHLLKKKSITSWEAIEMFSATRLSAIIFCLRKRGYGIATKDIAMTDKYGNKGFFAKYTLTSMPNDWK